MLVENLEIAARDGYKLAATRYLPDDAIDIVVLIASATGVKRRFYDAFADFLAAKGFVAITFDYRGIGDSRPVTLNKFQASMYEWGEKDLAGVIDWARSEYPRARLCAVGHSVGGQVVGLAENNDCIAAMIFVACQSGYWRLWPWWQRYFVWLLWVAIIPLLAALLAQFPASLFGMGESLPAGVALEWASWGRDPHYILKPNGMQARHNFNKLAAPVLCFSIANDFFAPTRAVDELLRYYPNIRATRRHLTARDLQVKRFGHFDFFRTRFRQSLWQECADWLSKNAEIQTKDKQVTRP